MEQQKRILYISSANPLVGPGAIGMDHYKALIEEGYKVDFLTKYLVKNHPEIKYVLKKPFNKYIELLKRPLFYLSKRFLYRKGEKGHAFFYLSENDTPVSAKRILTKIKNDYSAIIIFYWQEMLTFKTIEYIYNKQIKRPKVIFIAADFSCMTGGCHFVGNCKRYINGCGYCPMISSTKKNDFTARNVKFRINVLKELNPTILLNSYMKTIFEKSSVINENVKLEMLNITIDTEKFRPLPRKESLKKFKLLNYHSDFFILFGAQNIEDERKGVQYLIHALHFLYNSLTEEQRLKFHIITIGNGKAMIDRLPNFKQTHLGYVTIEQLPAIYSIANVYISPSIDDAGPSMVNQALACGTPVISFNIGTSIDVIKNKDTGFIIDLFDSKAMGEALFQLFMNPNLCAKMGLNARKISLEYNAPKVFIEKINSIIS